MLPTQPYPTDLKYEIVELVQYSGIAAVIYSVILKGENETIFEQFLAKYLGQFNMELKFIQGRLFIIGNETGARKSYFKEDEGKFGDKVCNLFDMPSQKLRLFCIKYGMDAILLGGGGPKPKGTRAWQDKPELKKEGELMIAISADIFRRIEIVKDLSWSRDGKLMGNLNNTEDEEN